MVIFGPFKPIADAKKNLCEVSKLKNSLVLLRQININVYKFVFDFGLLMHMGGVSN